MKKIIGLPITLLERYIDFMFEGHILLRLATNLLIAAACGVVFVLLHQIF